MSRTAPKFTSDPGVSLTAETILAHPDFSEARRIFIAEHKKVYEAGVFPGRFGADVGRVTTLAIIVCLHANYRQEDRDTWPTLNKLKTTVAHFGFASPRLIDQFAARLVQTGDLEFLKNPDDSRSKLIRPTEKLLAWDREWMAAHYAPLEMLYPNPGYSYARDRSIDFQIAHASNAIAAFDGIISMIMSNMDLMFLLTGTSALIIFLSVVEMVGPNAELSFREADLARLAKDFGVSRSHIRNILLASEAKGFVIRSGTRNAQYRLTPRLLIAFDRFIADSLLQSEITYRLGINSLSKKILSLKSADSARAAAPSKQSL